MIKEYLNHDHPNVPNFYNAICLQSQVFGYGRIYVYVGSFKTSLFSNLRRTISGLCNDYIALCYPTKFWKIVGKKFLSRLLDCSTQCGQCCGCFGFSTLTKVCRVINVWQSWCDGTWGRLDLPLPQRLAWKRWVPFYSSAREYFVIVTYK